LDGIGVSAIRVLMPQEYNSRYARVHNVNVLLNEVYAELLLELATGSKAHTVILDKYGGRAMALWKTPQSFRFVVETHAERYPEVAAASVLARAAFLDGLERTARNNGVVRLPKGASMEAQAFMRRLASDKGKDILRSVAKANFAPVKACLDSLF
jgi:ribonuclease HIII